MANTKDIVIEGWMEFSGSTICAGEDFKEEERDEIVLDMLGLMNLPCSGLKITYTGRELQVPNKHNGVSTFFEYRIAGREAFWGTTFHEWVKALGRVGLVYIAKLKDLDAELPWESIPKPIIVSPMHTALLNAMLLYWKEKGIK